MGLTDDAEAIPHFGPEAIRVPLRDLKWIDEVGRHEGRRKRSRVVSSHDREQDEGNVPGAHPTQFSWLTKIFVDKVCREREFGRRENKIHKGRGLFVSPMDLGVGQRFYTLSNGGERGRLVVEWYCDMRGWVELRTSLLARGLLVGLGEWEAAGML